jgi:glycosyltransferase involved in cell wall biosynthesis
MADVSVITTAFNAEPFIEAAVRSVLDQRGVEVEHIVVDDGSTDRTAQLVRKATDPRVRLIEAGRVGRGRALNLAVAAARAPFVAVQDADDVSHPQRLATELDALANHPELAGVGSGQLILGPDETPVWARLDARPHVIDITSGLVFYNPLSHTSLVFRRPALERVGGYNERRRNLFDWDLYIRLASVGLKLGKLSIPLVGKRIHPDQFFEAPSPASYALQEFRLQWHSLKLLGRNQLLGISFPLLFAYRCLPRGLRVFVRRQSNRTRRDRPSCTTN